MIPALILLAAIVIFRAGPGMADNSILREVAGYSPLMAFALCAGVFLPRRWAFWLPLTAVLVPHCLINAAKGFPVIDGYGLTVAVLVLAVVAAGVAVKPKASAAVLMGTSILSTVLFYLASNTVSFFMDPAYVKSPQGWWQAVTVGRPDYSPATWVFGMRQLGGDLVFTALFYAAFRNRSRDSSTALLVPAPATPSRA